MLQKDLVEKFYKIKIQLFHNTNGIPIIALRRILSKRKNNENVTHFNANILFLPSKTL